MHWFSIVSILISSCFIISAKAQTQSDLLPEGRTSALLVYHPVLRGMLLVDGYQFHNDGPQNDVWKWDGLTWKKLSASGPGSKSLSAGDLDGKSNLLYVFGGIGEGNYDDLKNDLWTFDGKSWNQVAINMGTRDHHEMVYCESINAFVLYGGLTDKREYDTTTWIIRDNQVIAKNVPGPGARYHFAMAYDKARKKLVLYGGGKANARDTHWEFDGMRWQQVKLSSSPGKRIRHSLVYDEAHKVILMHGGDGKGETWAWKGQEWKKVAEGGPVADLIALGYDPVRKVVVAFGGSGPQSTLLSALWELKDFQWKKVSDNGTWQWIDNQLVRLGDR